MADLSSRHLIRQGRGRIIIRDFAALAEFEKMMPAIVRPATSIGQPGTKVSDLCQELGVTRQTLYRHVSPTGTPPGRCQASIQKLEEPLGSVLD